MRRRGQMKATFKSIPIIQIQDPLTPETLRRRRLVWLWYTVRSTTHQRISSQAPGRGILMKSSSSRRELYGVYGTSDIQKSTPEVHFLHVTLSVQFSSALLCDTICSPSHHFVPISIFLLIFKKVLFQPALSLLNRAPHMQKRMYTEQFRSIGMQLQFQRCEKGKKLRTSTKFTQGW